MQNKLIRLNWTMTKLKLISNLWEVAHHWLYSLCIAVMSLWQCAAACFCVSNDANSSQCIHSSPFITSLSHCLSSLGSRFISAIQINRAEKSHTFTSKTQQAVNNLQQQLKSPRLETGVVFVVRACVRVSLLNIFSSGPNWILFLQSKHAATRVKQKSIQF